MIDIYMNGAEVHAETPEEEREASLILSAALSGKSWASPSKLPAATAVFRIMRRLKAVRAASTVMGWRLTGA